MLIRKIVLLCVSMFLSLTAICQDFDLIFQNLPDVGAFAKYRFKSIKENGKISEWGWTFSVTKKELIDGEECLLIEIFPFRFKTLTTKTGTLGIFLKKETNEKERENFLFRAKKVMFAQVGKEPYEVEKSVLEMLREDSKDFKYEKVEKLKEKKIVEFKDKIKREVLVFDSEITFYENDGEKQKYFGIKEMSKDVPFYLVKEEFTIHKIGKSGEIKKTTKSLVELTDFSYDGAKSAFLGKKMKKKGIWGIIFD